MPQCVHVLANIDKCMLIKRHDVPRKKGGEEVIDAVRAAYAEKAIHLASILRLETRQYSRRLRFKVVDRIPSGDQRGRPGHGAARHSGDPEVATTPRDRQALAQGKEQVGHPVRRPQGRLTIQADSACSSSEDDGTPNTDPRDWRSPTRSVKLASLEPTATRKSPTTVADDV